MKEHFSLSIECIDANFLSVFKIVNPLALSIQPQAAQARDVTLAFERLQRCDLQGFVWELYGFALKT